MELFYGTTERGIDRIHAAGFVQGPSYWGTEEVANLLADRASEADGTAPVVLRADLDAFDDDELCPDPNALEQLADRLELLTAPEEEERTEEEIALAWEESAKGWDESLAILGSVRYLGSVDAEDVEVAS